MTLDREKAKDIYAEGVAVGIELGKKLGEPAMTQSEDDARQLIQQWDDHPDDATWQAIGDRMATTLEREVKAREAAEAKAEALLAFISNLAAGGNEAAMAILRKMYPDT